MESAPASPIVAGRGCGTCTLCCKVLRIDELAKPQGTWCPKCDVGRGCAIYADRPGECRSFYCGYLTVEGLGPEWWPAKSKIVLVSELGGKRIAAHMDPARPDAWRNEPFYSQLKRWAQDGVITHDQVVAYVGNRVTVIFPDEDVSLGPVAANERIVTRQTRTDQGVKLEALKLRDDDPRIAGTPIGLPYTP